MAPTCYRSLPAVLSAGLQVPVYSMHRSERNWRDPLAFLPERWLPGTPEVAEVGGRGPGRGEAAQHGMLLCCNVLPCNH